jgi:hypothetical protein
MTAATAASSRPAGLDQARVVTEAVLKAARILEVPAGVLAGIIGVSPATVSRMRGGSYALEPASKAFELGLYFIRLFRSLDALAGSNDTFSRAWLHGGNRDLGERPIDKIRTIRGLQDVCDYIDAHRAPV